MENGPLITPSFERPTDGGDKKETKKKTGADAKVARSLDKLPLFDKPEPAAKTEKLANKLTLGKDQLPTVETVDESGAPIERLSPVETKHVTRELAAGHLRGLEAVAENDDPDLAAPREFLDKVAAGDEAEAAFRETAAGWGLTEAEIAAALAETEPEAADDEPAESAELLPPDEAADDESEIIIDHAKAEPTAEPAVGAGGNGRHGQGAGGLPPTPPAGNPGSADGPESNSPAPDMIPLSTARYYERRAQNNGLLLGGLLGYLIGRRRGRIKTEKRLLPVQKKLTREVKRLNDDLVAKESRLRRLSSERANLPAAVKSSRNPLPERPQAGRRETRLGLEKPKPAERLGHLLVAAEAPTAADKRPNNIRQAFRAEEVKVMNRRELLELSEKIVVEGASLRHIYESHLVGEKQLRHLVGEYLRGKDIRRDLRREMVEREIDFERDPLLRDRVRSQLTSSDTPLNQLLEKVGALPGESQTDERHQAAAAEKDLTRAAKQKRRRRLADTTMVSVIVLLAAAVAILLTR